jgi:hypothetical protein
LSGWPGRLLVTPHQCGTSPCLSARWRSAGDLGVQVSRSWCHELAPTSPETALSTVRFTV